ncbi:MAG: hypothetical protein Q4E52_01580 [Fibrobacter sp.]|nr:hypothetical protein [Fibrobacter sp.]
MKQEERLSVHFYTILQQFVFHFETKLPFFFVFAGTIARTVPRLAESGKEKG